MAPCSAQLGLTRQCGLRTKQKQGKSPPPPSHRISPYLYVYSRSLWVETPIKKKSQSNVCTGFLRPLVFNQERMLRVWLWPPSACGHQGAAHEVVGRAAATRVGCYFRACSAVWRILPPPCFRRYTPPPRIATPVLRWASAARPSAAWGILQPTGWALSQTKAWPLPGPIKPPAFPAFQPSLSLGVAN